MNVAAVEQYVREQLGSRLPANLYYHNLSHTLDVAQTSLEIASEEGVTSGRDLQLLKTAALLHDTGFLNVYDNHEEEGCRIARNILPGLGYSEEDLETICGLIMKTKLPQQPETILEKIICDADLDHLGREDFPEVGDRLFREWMAWGRLKDPANWNMIQFNFISAHHYWTAFSQRERQPVKMNNIESLKKLISG